MVRHRVSVLLIDQVLPLDFAIPMHVLAREASEFYDVGSATIDGKAITVAGGLRLVPDGDLRLLHGTQTVIVPGYAGILMTPRREGEQAQFIEAAPAPPGDDAMSLVQHWMLSVLSDPITIDDMASKAHMSRRNFQRRFVERTSTAPLAWLQQQRIGRTKELLESTSLTVEEIAMHVGLGSPANLRQHFRRATSLSPIRYRELFSHK